MSQYGLGQGPGLEGLPRIQSRIGRGRGRGKQVKQETAGEGLGNVGYTAAGQSTVGRGVSGGKGKMCWSGQLRSVHTQESVVGQTAFDWTKSREALEDVEYSLVAPPKIIQLTDIERNILTRLSNLVKEEKVEGILPKEITLILKDSENPFELVLKICSSSNDFREGKNKGVAGSLVLGLEKFVKETPSLIRPSQHLQDWAFYKFSTQSNAAIMKSGFNSFGMVGLSRYTAPVFDMASKRKDYKGACDTAVALELYDKYPIHIFCLPLLLLDKPSTMERYLEKSPNAAKEMMGFLDGLNEDNLVKVSELCSKYPDIKPTGSNKLMNKPLDKMIKKYAEKFSLDPSLFPLTCAKRASADLYYWVKQMFTEEEHSLTLGNWRDLIERKVEGNEVLKNQLINNLLNFDVSEAQYFDKRFNLNYFTKEESSISEEDWEAECEPRNDLINKSQEQEGEDFYCLGLSHDKIIFVDTREKFDSFLKMLPMNSAVGVDAEFMSRFQVQKLSLLQVATLTNVYLLDFESLPDKLEENDYKNLAEIMFSNPALVKVGFGLSSDVRLLSRSGFRGLETLPQISKCILNLDTVRNKLSTLLSLPQSGAKGLSGFCSTVLGKPLSKVDQISDWSRRPLRPAQLVYAALDAFVCLEIYYKLLSLAAKEKELQVQLQTIFREAMGSKDVKKPQKDKTVKIKEKQKNVAISHPPRLHSESISPSELRIVCDDMLQGLCKKLRLFGVDCLALENGQDHMDCVSMAGTHRYVLSRGGPAIKLSKHLPTGHCLDIQSNDLDLQVEEVFHYFHVVAQQGDLFSRCVLCNGGSYYLLDSHSLMTIYQRKMRTPHTVVGVQGEQHEEEEEVHSVNIEDDDINTGDWGHTWKTVEVSSSYTGHTRVGKVNLISGHTEEGVSILVEKVPREVIKSEAMFWVCGVCGKIYWQGSHWGKAQDKVKSLLGVSPQPNPAPSPPM